MNCVLVPYIRNTEPENTVPAAVGEEREMEGKKAAAVGEEGKKAAAGGEERKEESQNVVEEGEKMGGVYIYRLWHAECCMQLSLAQFVCFR